MSRLSSRRLMSDSKPSCVIGESSWCRANRCVLCSYYWKSPCRFHLSQSLPTHPTIPNYPSKTQPKAAYDFLLCWCSVFFFCLLCVEFDLTDSKLVRNLSLTLVNIYPFFGYGGELWYLVRPPVPALAPATHSTKPKLPGLCCLAPRKCASNRNIF